MSSIKKMFAVMMTIILIITMPVAASALADKEPQSDAVSESEPSTKAQYYSDADTKLSIDQYGYTEVEGKLVGIPGVTTQVRIYLYLQKYTAGGWTTVYSWSKIFYTHSGTLKQYAAVRSGFNYRVKGSYYAYSGENYEQTYDYSPSVYH